MPYEPPQCEVVPLANHQALFMVRGQERLRWHFAPDYPRPYFFPLLGPSGQPLTRMGHPGAPNHDHHQSIWFAHNKVVGVDFWGNNSTATIRQKEWLCYHDGDEARMAVRLAWFDGHDPRELLVQELVVAVRPADDGETLVELQSTFHPTSAMLEFGKTNFGFLAIRVAKSISAYFGGGELTNSNGLTGEPQIFGKPATWMDYSGPVSSVTNGRIVTVDEGITYFDNPSNPRFPNHWHVREDGWMGCSPCMIEPLQTTQAQPLTLRYLLHAHRNRVDRERAHLIATEFANSKVLMVQKSTKKHTAFEILRAST